MLTRPFIASLALAFAIMPLASAQEAVPKPISQGAAEAEVVSGEVIFPASDGGEVYGDLIFSAAGKEAPFIILFHQARASGSAEYEAIAPVLEARGYNLLIVDQRSGGRGFSGQNRTVKARGGSTRFCPAYPDVEGALNFVKDRGFTGPRFAWGSSYSGGLTMKLASEHGGDLTGALVFSPATGGSMGACAANNFIASTKIPVIAFRPDSEMNRGGKRQRQSFLDAGHAHYVAEGGVHGSSMLDASRARGDVEPTWAEVIAFLEANGA